MLALNQYAEHLYCTSVYGRMARYRLLFGLHIFFSHDFVYYGWKLTFERNIPWSDLSNKPKFFLIVKIKNDEL